MSFSVVEILCSTTALVCNKARDAFADNVRNRDATCAKLREMIQSDLGKIKSKLDGLCRKDLLASFNSLEVGVASLHNCLDNTDLDQKHSLKPKMQNYRAKTKETQNAVEAGGILKNVSDLSDAMEKPIESNTEYKAAKEKFTSAQQEANSAFSNEALNIKDRIFAGKLRIASEILGKLDNPEIAIPMCQTILKQLHELKDISDTFSVYLNGGVKSLVCKSDRVRNVLSVMMINYVLFRFISKFNTKPRLDLIVVAWPTIKVRDRSFNPILHWEEVATKESKGNMLAHHPNGLLLAEAIYPGFAAVNGKGEIVVGYRDNIKIISTASTSKEHKLPDTGEGKDIGQRIAALAVDNDNNIYVVRWFGTITGKGFEKCMLNVLDEKCCLKFERKLDFFEASARLDRAKIAINQSNDIIILKFGDPNVYVCDNTGELKHTFPRDSLGRNSLSISGKNEIMLSRGDLQALHIKSEEGDEKLTIEVPEGHKIHGVAFHHVFHKIIILTHVQKEDSCYLHFFSEAGKFETSKFFCRRINHELPQITSHPSGPTAVVRYTSVTQLI